MPRKLIAFLFAAAIAVSAAAQAPATATSILPATSTVVTDSDSHETRDAFDSVLRRYPSEVSRVLKLDPSLMTLLHRHEHRPRYTPAQPAPSRRASRGQRSG